GCAAAERAVLARLRAVENGCEDARGHSDDDTGVDRAIAPLRDCTDAAPARPARSPACRRPGARRVVASVRSGRRGRATRTRAPARPADVSVEGPRASR